MNAKLQINRQEQSFGNERGAVVVCMLVAAFFLSSYAADGNIYIATDCSETAVSNKIYSATNGDTVLIPAGSAIWTNQLDIYYKGISLIGAGAGQTIITNGYSLSGGTLIDVRETYPYFTRISGFTICSNAPGTSAMLNIGGTTFDDSHVAQTNYFRVDNMQFTNITEIAAAITGWALGVIDHCSFICYTNGGATGISITGEGPYSWDTRPPTWGDTNKVYVEDCSFSWLPVNDNANGAVDSYNSARWCFRYNNVTNINVGCHGSDSGGIMRSTHSYEVYENNFYTTSGWTGYEWLLGGFRGGTGVFWSNSLTGPYLSPVIVIENYRCTGINIYGVYQTWNSGTFYGPGTNVQTSLGMDYTCILANTGNEPPNATYWQQFYPEPCCNPWGAVDGTNAFDGNTDPVGYPAYDSIGRTSPTTYYTNVPTPSWTNYAQSDTTNALYTWLSTNIYGNYTTNDFGFIYTNLQGATKGYTVQPSQPAYQWSNYLGGTTNVAFDLIDSYTNTGIYSNISQASVIIEPNRDYYDYTQMPGYTPLVYPHPLVSAAFVAFGGWSPTNAVYSYDGTNWLTSTMLNAPWSSMTYGAGLFVVIASDYTNAAYSTDGINWITSPGGLPVVDYWNSMTYGNGTFVAVSGDTSVAYSTNGIHWSVNSTGLPSSDSWISVTYGNGTFVAISGSGDNAAAYSADGINWTASPGGLPNPGGGVAFWQSVTYGNGMFVAIPFDSDTGVAAYSTDGINWSASSLNGGLWDTVTYGNGTFVVIGTDTGGAYYSTDGINWTGTSLPASDNWITVAYSSAYGIDIFVAFATDTNAAYSADGINWTALPGGKPSDGGSLAGGQ